jgi:hypothetical protein
VLGESEQNSNGDTIESEEKVTPGTQCSRDKESQTTGKSEGVKMSHQHKHRNFDTAPCAPREEGLARPQKEMQDTATIEVREEHTNRSQSYKLAREQRHIDEGVQQTYDGTNVSRTAGVLSTRKGENDSELEESPGGHHPEHDTRWPRVGIG